MNLRYATTVFLSVVAGCTSAPGPDPSVHGEPARHVDVRFTDYKRNGTLAEHGAGTAYIFGDAIKVVLRSGVFPFTATPSVRLVGLTVGLATGDTTRWDLSRESSKVFVSDVKFLGDTVADSVVFWIRNTHGVNLNTHWLVLVEYAEMYVRQGAAWSRAMRPVWGDVDVFRQDGTVRQQPNQR